MMTYSIIGLIKLNSVAKTKVLVMSEENKYYVWETGSDYITLFHLMNGVLPADELTLATPRQIEIGRGSLWTPNSSKVMTSVIYYGVVSGGRSNKTILVKDDDAWLIVTVSNDSIKDLKQGDSLVVDSRFLLPAREDHIRAGLGYGKLSRKKRIPIS